MKSVIFVCLGNICRSSLAEGVAKHKAKELGLNIKIKSAGTSTYHNGEAPCAISQKLARKNGIDISRQKSQHISEFNLNEFDLFDFLQNSSPRTNPPVGLSLYDEFRKKSI